MNQASIEKIVIESVEALDFSGSDSRIVDRSFILFGTNATIDSLDLVSIITEVEEALSDEYEIEVSLTNDHALSRLPSPYDSVGNLVDYICEILQDKE